VRFLFCLCMEHSIACSNIWCTVMMMMLINLMMMMMMWFTYLCPHIVIVFFSALACCPNFIKPLLVLYRIHVRPCPLSLSSSRSGI
jgi:hypothetical protein